MSFAPDEECSPTASWGGTSPDLPPRLPSPPRSARDLESLTGLPAALRQSGRFHVRKLLGCGTFGEVYLAHDEKLSRLVALKVPRSDKFTGPDDLEHFVAEARAAAALRHPGIVTVYDVHADGESVFIVLEYVDGCTLAKLAADEKLTVDDIVRLVVDIAQAVAYAHEHGLVHRDLKPANILVDSRRKIRVMDFGLAVHASSQRQLARHAAGTPVYMAPEQVRGETHRLDGRTDIWSIGVMLYWLLTGRRAFDGSSDAEVFDEILHSEPRPPRQFSPEIPRELERICLKCLCRRMSDRYATGHDLADDLIHWRDDPSRSGASAENGREASGSKEEQAALPQAPVIPKGLRSFDQHDADFFLSLLPGPYDRSGVPESVRFWKQAIDETESTSTFSVGLMYGPSGCGKTSLMRAGIIPRLASHVRVAYVEAAPLDADKRLQAAIVRLFPRLKLDVPLAQTLAELREGNDLKSGEKLLMVLDQCEQCLDGSEADDNNPLVAALRHCDGGRIQCLVMVRDDFTMAATRLMNALEVPIVEGQNCAAVDVFRRDHARRVLRRFGEAYGQLADVAPRDGDRFLDQAIDLLAEGNVVTPVRLAAFGELTRRQEWNAATLRQLDSRGLGVALLEAFLGEESLHPTNRPHREAARKVLAALLPEDRVSLKGRMRPQGELMEACGYQRRPRDFDALVAMLDKELRLISPADPHRGVVESSSDGASSAPRERHFQLAHDYLVPSLNAWLTEKQRETGTGRAQLLLDTISQDWNARPSAHRLPTLFEWIAIQLRTRTAAWTATQRRMMAAARRRHLLRAGGLLLILATGVAGIVIVNNRNQRLWNEQQARAAAERLVVADVALVPELLRELDVQHGDLAVEFLKSVAASPERTADERLRAHLFLARKEETSRPALVESLLSAGPDEHRAIEMRLALFSTSLAPSLWDQVAQATSEDRLLRAACALAAWDPDADQWKVHGPRVADALAHYVNPFELPSWVEALVPVGNHLTPQLVVRFREPGIPSTERSAAAQALVRFLRTSPKELATLSVEADPGSFPDFLAALRNKPADAIATLQSIWSEQTASPDPQQITEAAQRRATAAIAMARLGDAAAFWSSMEGTASPDVRTATIDACRRFGISSETLLERVNSATNPLARQAALIALAGEGPTLPSTLQAQLVEKSLDLYEHDGHAGVHAAAEFVLRQLNQWEAVSKRQSAAGSEVPARNWQINSKGITMVSVHGPREFAQGSPPTEGARDGTEKQRIVRLAHSFAISAHEITLDQYRQHNPQLAYDSKAAPSGDCPANFVSWFDAVKYCRWLSEQEGLPESEMCYPPAGEIVAGFRAPDDWLRRTGYRLPTESEWECACRADTTTARFYGETPDRLDRYAFYLANSRGRVWPVGSLRPNPWGLFDIYGNVAEWCQDQVSADGSPLPSFEGTSERIIRGAAHSSPERESRSARRSQFLPATPYSFIGFRIARTIRD